MYDLATTTQKAVALGELLSTLAVVSFSIIALILVAIYIRNKG